MRNQFANLTRIDSNREITKETDYEFWYRMELALLLALQEKGTLSFMQLRQAEEKLTQQRRNRAKKLLEGDRK